MSQVTLVGNVTSDLNLKYVSNGIAVASVSLAVQERIKDKTTGEYKDGESSFYRLNIWRAIAENAANSLAKGNRVIVTGKLKTRQFEHEGVKKTSVEVDVEEIGPSLRFHTARPEKVSSGNSGGFSGGSNAWGGNDDGSAPF